MAVNYHFKPDYTVAPGSVLKERLEVQGISQAEFARRCGRSAKLISEIIAGKARIEPQTALQFEKVLGVDASIWIGIDSIYQIHRARKIEEENAATNLQWAKAFPIRELVNRECFQNPKSASDSVLKLLEFFGSGSVNAWSERYKPADFYWRHSPSHKSNEAALTAWLRLGELEAERQFCKKYNESNFKQATVEIRKLTRKPIAEALQQTCTLCNKAGVALALVPPLPKTALSGAAWWYSSYKAVIQLSARHKTDDHLWFSFFHEAAHIILHSKKKTYIDETDGKLTHLESEANDWASNALVSKSSWEQFLAKSPKSAKTVQKFASEEKIAPGIVVGMLQHEGHLPWSHLNRLKVRYQWKEK